ncbi:EpsG family protein [Erwinia sp. MMLR14_017]|uniref:EpsG family protein n=1 Tax=Erwinia sp. MMLR14_017 TaxID=3093842 RepID=UPI0029900DA6|nr:EpsG family protein [Erwinia sp. MMLR14_017]MDW8847216.1 EpsG family protein [Erwinia sp. MMLR14_017]
MEIYAIGYFLFYFFALISVDKNSKASTNKVIFSVSFFILLIFCALRGIIDRDHQNYLTIYGYIVHGDGYLIEPSYYFFSLLSDFLTSGPILLFVLYAIIGLGFKFYTFRTYSIFPVISVLVYYSNYYFLHEMTQIRIGVSIAIAIIAINNWLNGNKKFFFILLFISCLFHYSALIFLIIPFMPKRRINAKEMAAYAFVILISYIMFILHFGFATAFSYIPIGYVQEKFAIYSQKAEMGEVQAINVFSVMQLIKIINIILMYFFVAKKHDDSKFFNLMLRFYIFSTICWVVFFDIPVFAVRLSDLFGISEIFILPYLLYVSKNKYIGVFLLTLFTGMVFYINIFHNILLEPYVTFFN